MPLHGLRYGRGMLDAPPPGARVAPAVSRNREPILEVLRAHLPARGLVLEIAAGTGEHAVHFAAALPHLQWLPADADPEALTSIAAWRAQCGPANLLSPHKLDAADPASWNLERVDAIVCINMIHIAPRVATEGLIRGAAHVLPPGAPLILYGPFIEPGLDTAPSNVAFDHSLRSRNPEWGLRNITEVSEMASRQGLVLHARVPMPANNLSLVYRRLRAE
jgi:hypothetical protein